MRNIAIIFSLSFGLSSVASAQNTDNRNYKIPMSQKPAASQSQIGVFKPNSDFNGSFLSVHNYKHTDTNRGISPGKIKTIRIKSNQEAENFNPHLSFRNYKTQKPANMQAEDTKKTEVAFSE